MILWKKIKTVSLLITKLTKIYIFANKILLKILAIITANLCSILWVCKFCAFQVLHQLIKVLKTGTASLPGAVL